MRRAATILLACLAGQHCTTTNVMVGEESASDEPSAEIPTPETARRAKEDPSPDDETASPTLPGRLGNGEASGSVAGEGGARYVVGVFSGRMKIGDITLKSRGEDDVFVARYDANGALAWAHSVGSSSNERGPRLRYEAGRLQVLATTGGQVDCGGDALGTWSSEMFFLCYFDSDGTSTGGAVFPTGAP